VHTNSYIRISLLGVLLFSAVLCQAENPVKTFRNNPARHPGAVHTRLQKTSQIAATVTKELPFNSPFFGLTISPEAIEAHLKKLALFAQVHQKLTADLAAQTLLGSVNKYSQPGVILFRNNVVGELQPKEYILMAAAYDGNGREVASLRTTVNDQPVTIQELEKSLSGYDVKRIMLVLRQSKPAPDGSRSVRLIDYYVDSNVFTVEEVE